LSGAADSTTHHLVWQGLKTEPWGTVSRTKQILTLRGNVTVAFVSQSRELFVVEQSFVKEIRSSVQRGEPGRQTKLMTNM
jgi:hypothetical protein